MTCGQTTTWTGSASRPLRLRGNAQICKLAKSKYLLSPWRSHVRSQMSRGSMVTMIHTMFAVGRGDEVLLNHNRVDKEPASNSAKWDAKAKMLLPTFFPTIIRMKKCLKINKTGLSRLVKGHNSPTNSNNLVGLCFQAYLSVHSSENGQTATHFTRQKDLRGKQWVTNPTWKPPKWRLNPHVVRVVYVSLK